MFEIGYQLPILGKIITSPGNQDVMERRNGSFRTTRSQNGKRPIWDPFCGFTENVCCHLAFTCFQRLTVFPLLLAGAGKTVLWYI
jgi:hypothetical protein